VLGEHTRGGIGLDEVRWTAPVRPGDTLRAEVEVIARSEAPRRGRGRVVFGFTVRNQRGETVLTFRALSLVASRAAQGS
jgi:3-hydroxybutyryl-CoA dehydratase